MIGSRGELASRDRLQCVVCSPVLFDQGGGKAIVGMMLDLQDPSERAGSSISFDLI